MNSNKRAYLQSRLSPCITIYYVMNTHYLVSESLWETESEQWEFTSFLPCAQHESSKVAHPRDKYSFFTLRSSPKPYPSDIFTLLIPHWSRGKFAILTRPLGLSSLLCLYSQLRFTDRKATYTEGGRINPAVILSALSLPTTALFGGCQVLSSDKANNIGPNTRVLAKQRFARTHSLNSLALSSPQLNSLRGP
uniref:Uncharacterized protein n=1 Tax=Steinernema glaseri TaxID=37863 RepID=A0A1I7YE31_9BILA